MSRDKSEVRSQNSEVEVYLIFSSGSSVFMPK